MPCLPLGTNNKSTDKLIDIERHLCDHAWRWLARKNWWTTLFRDKLYRFEVNWNYLDVSHKLTQFKVRTNGEEEKAKYDKLGKLQSKVQQRDLCLFRTEFTNNSESTQKFTFSTERSTTSSASISIQEGWTVGANLNLEMAPPVPGSGILKAAGSDVDPCKITGGLSGSLQVTKTKDQTYEETLTWSVDTEIAVEKNYRTVASLMVREEQFGADFRLESTIRCLRKVVPIKVYRKKTGELEQILEIASQTFAKIFTQKNPECSTCPT